MKNFFYLLMTDKLNGPVFIPFKALLWIFSVIYLAAILLRGAFYRLCIFKTYKAPLKVISVGNITLGGTGKTPFTVALARILESVLKKNVSILIRGYGWDEQEMLKRNVSDVPVLVGTDRSRSCQKAIRLYGSDTAILDDGFQHWELARDLDIVLVDSRDPFGNGELFPRGILREPEKSLKRSDIVVLTKVNKAKVDTGKIKEEIAGIKKEIVFLEAVHAPRYFYEGRGRRVSDLSHIRGKRAILLSSIGDPLYFEETVKDLGGEVVEHIKFPDHHDYRISDIESVVKRCDERNFDFVVTTEKDIVKLNRLGLGLGRYTVLTLAVEMEIVSGREILIDRLRSLYIR